MALLLWCSCGSVDYIVSLAWSSRWVPAPSVPDFCLLISVSLSPKSPPPFLDSIEHDFLTRQ